MGYLSQKKRQEHINIFLKTSIFVVLSATICALFGRESKTLSYFTDWYFQFYFLLLCVFVFALFVRRWLYAFVLFLFIVINFVFLSSFINIFLNSTAQGTDNLNLAYRKRGADILSSVQTAKENNIEVLAINTLTEIPPIENEDYYISPQDVTKEKSFILSRTAPNQGGKVYFSSKKEASYMIIPQGNKTILVLNIDFSDLQEKEEETVYNNLAKFVQQQNMPIIIVGDFGLVPWSKSFQKFLRESGLEIKNRVILSNGTEKINIFRRPTLNVLGYKTLGLNEIKILSEPTTGDYLFLFKLFL